VAVRQHERAAVERALGTRAPNPRREEGGLLAAQRLVGNLAVQRLVAARGHDATAAGPTLLRAVAAVQRKPDPAPAPAPDPLTDSRIAWIDALPVVKRATIDGLGGPLTTRVRKLEAKLAKADQTKDDAAGAAARTELDAIKRKNASDWSTHRIAFMDYMGCTLGGDAGVRRYWEALTTWGDEWGFVVHPEVARRLDRVKAELAQYGVPMPQTTVGQSLRGDHTANKRERKSPGMMSHAMGVAADWFAYKNVHLTDERLMRVISAVTGGPHHMQLPKGGLSTITAMGEASMGTGTVDPAKAQEVIDAIGAEFDRLQAASDRLTTSLSTPKEEVLALQSALAPLAGAAETAKVAWQKAVSQKAKPAQQAEKKAAFDTAQAALDAKETELKPRLEALFAPWLTALDQKAKEIEKAAADRGVSLDEVTTEQTLKAKRGALVVSAAPAKKALAKIAAAAKGAGTRAAGVRGAAAGAVAYLGSGKAPRAATADQLGTWPGTVGGIMQRAAAAVSGASRLKEEAELLSGAAPAPLGAGKDAKPAFRGERDLTSWVGTLDTAEEALRSTAKDLEAAAATLPPGQRDAAQDLAGLVASNAAVTAREGIGKAGLAQLQEQKKELYWVQQAAKDLLQDASFMFKDPSVKNPGVVQLLGQAGDQYGGGGFFGTTAVGRRNPKSDEAGFGKLFFQTMAKYGFEPAASWHTADTMHFEVEALVQTIVPPEHCEEPPADAEDKARADPKLTGAALEKKLKAIEDQREKTKRGAVNAAAYVDSAEASRTALDAERAR
jgi:hypothetical protein